MTIRSWKKITIIILTIFSISLFGKDKYGIRIGYSISQFRDTDIKPYHGYTFGLTKEFSFTDEWHLQLELDYTTRGADLGEVPVLTDVNYGDGVYLYDITFKSGFIEIPLLVKYSIPLKSTFKIEPYLGFSIGVALTKSDVNSLGKLGEADSVDYEYKFSIEEGMSGAHLCQSLNIGFMLECNQQYQFDFRYYHSFVDYGRVESIRIDHKFRSFIFTLGYKF